MVSFVRRQKQADFDGAFRATGLVGIGKAGNRLLMEMFVTARVAEFDQHGAAAGDNPGRPSPNRQIVHLQQCCKTVGRRLPAPLQSMPFADGTKHCRAFQRRLGSRKIV